MSAHPWNEARRRLAGGVNSPVRAFKAVGGRPIFIRQGLGPCVYDWRGRSYIDFCLSWGAILLGHAEEETVSAIRAQAALGTSFGTATENETRLAALIQRAVPSMERLRLTSSGTEAAMSAIRLARGYTGRERIVKFEGCYHGHADSLLVKAGSGLATFGSPDSAGVPQDLARMTSVLPYNDAGAVRRFFARNRDVACVIVEPIAGNMGLVPARPEFLRALRRETSAAGALLIFDEVISGFRVRLGGAQELYGIRPDLTLLGKIIGGGLPMGAFGGRKDVMGLLSPEGPVYQAGTLSGNPLSVAAGISVLSRLDPAFYERLETRCASFGRLLAKTLRRKGWSAARVGSMFTVFFSRRAPLDWGQVRSTDTRRFRPFFRRLLERGIYGPPSAFETSFVSAAHGERELDAYVRALDG